MKTPFIKGYTVRKSFCLLISSLFILGFLGGCIESTTQTPAKTNNPIKIDIRTEVERVIIHYQEESFWTDDEFSRILENKNKFRSDFIEKFSDNVSKYGERKETVANAEIEFNSERKSTILKCDVHDAVSKSGNDYHSTFRWFLGPLGLDFLDDHFERFGNKLSWEGSINDVRYTIVLNFPASIDNCHAHIWWTEED